jgi:predicted Zn-dependent peptidase
MRIPGIFWSSPLVLGCLVAGCLVAGCLVAPQPRIATSESVSYPVKSYDDASGIRVVLEQSPDYGVASVVLSISAGSAQESPAKAGLAHLAEHLVFQGSHAETNLWNRIVELGGFGINGATDWDATRFWATVPTASAAKLVALFAEILRDPLKDVDQQGFESELKVVREEFHLRSENGAPGQAVGWLFPALFSPAHPYGHPIAGTPQSLEHLSLADVQSFVAEHYKVDLATIAISAPETTERESAWVASGFGGAPGVPHRQFAPGRSSDAAYARVNGGLQDHEAPIAAPALWIGWPVPRQQTPGGEVLALLPSLLQGAFAAERRVFDPRVVRIEPASFTGRQGAVLYIKLSLRDADSAESLVGTFINQLRSALTNLIYTPSWLDYVRQSAALESTYREENILTRTLNLANSTDLTDDPLFARKEAARLGGVTAEAASAYVGQYLQEETARAVLVTPTTKARSASLIEAAASGQPAGAVAPLARRLTVDPAEATRWIHEPARVARTTLQSGLEIWVVRQRQSPFHAALLDFRGGRELGKNPGVFVAVPWARLPLGPPAVRSGLLGRFEIRSEDTRFAYRGVRSDVESTLRHLRRELDASVSWPPRQFTDQVELYKKEEQQPLVRMRVEHFATLFGAHVYGRSPTVEQIQAVSANDIHWWFDEVIRPENGVLIVVGDVDPAAVFQLAASVFGDFVDLGAGYRPPVPPPPSPTGPTGGGIRIQAYHQPDLTAARLLYSCLVPLAGSDAYPPARLYQQLLHDRLHDELRDRARTSYSISLELSPERARTAILTMSADVDPAAMGSLVDLMKQKLAAGAPSLVNQRDLEIAKMALIGDQMWQTASTSQLADRLFLAWNLGWPVESVLDTARRAITAREAQVQAVEQACRDTAVLSSLGQ